VKKKPSDPPAIQLDDVLRLLEVALLDPARLELLPELVADRLVQTRRQRSVRRPARLAIRRIDRARGLVRLGVGLRRLCEGMTGHDSQRG
jgi:hypothetical protein